jgi:hypothetical protein
MVRKHRKGVGPRLYMPPSVTRAFKANKGLGGRHHRAGSGELKGLQSHVDRALRKGLSPRTHHVKSAKIHNAQHFRGINTNIRRGSRLDWL